MKIQLFFIVLFFIQGFFVMDGHAQRPRESFNDNWKFILNDGAFQTIALDDSEWRDLDLPHDWGIEGPFDNNLENNTGLLPWKGIGWYRKHFEVSQSAAGKKLFIDFDGAMANAKVWLNGKLVGEWPYGYTSFRFDLTPYINFGAKNVLAVRLDTEKLDSRWYPGAGIYRNVWLVKTNPVHIKHWGVYLTTPEISAEKGTVSLRVDLQNQKSKAADISVAVKILDQVGNDIVESEPVAALIPAANSHRFRMVTKVEQPVLWDVQNPYLYKAVVSVRKDDQLIDEYQTRFGFRTLKFDTTGFYLNGKRVEIKGVCNHHDLGPLGGAFNKRAAERQLEILQEMGCNAIRTSHNPPAPELLELCDEMGFLVQVEAFDCCQKGKKKNDYNIQFKAWHEQDLRAMVRRDWNHPSVFMWSVGNEVPDQWNPPLAKALVNIVHMEDPTRPVTSGCNWDGAGWSGYQETMDVFGYNYCHWGYERYFNDEKNKHQPFHASETSSCLSSRGEYFFPVVKGLASEHLAGKGIFHVSSYDLLAPGWGNPPDFQFMLNDKYPRVMGEFVWTGFDYLGEPTPFNSDRTNLLNFKDEKRKADLKKWLDKLGAMEIPSRSSYFGILDLCGFKKDRFYIYQARWRPDFPMAHILPHWNWPERVGEITPVHVYTSGDEAELFLNGKSQGHKKLGQYEYRFRWDDVIYEPGELKVVTWKNGKAWAEEIVCSTKKAAKVSFLADDSKIKNDGEDLVFVTVRIEDQDNRLVPRSHNLVEFQLDGPGEIVAVGNGDPTSHESFQASQRKAFNGLCQVIIKAHKNASGQLTLKAKSKGLESAKLSLDIF